MMDPQLIEHLRVADPMEEPELNLDNIPISSIQVLLEPPTSAPGGDDDDSFYSPLDHFQNLVKLTMTNSQCKSLEGFPHLPLLQTLLLADNELSTGFEALAEADLQTLVRLDLTANKISDMSVLRPLDSLENLQYLYLAENEVADAEHYRSEVFDILPQLITVDGLDRNGVEVAEQRDNVVSNADEEAQYSEEGSDVEYDDEERAQGYGGKYHSQGSQGGEEDEDEYDEEDDEIEAGPPAHHPQSHHNADESEDIGSEDEDEEDYDEEEHYDSNSDSDKENRPIVSGKTTGPMNPAGDEEDDDELDDEEDEDDEDDEEGGHVPQQQQQHPHHHEIGSDSGEEDEDEDLEEEEDEEDEEDEEEDEGPGLAYLLTEDIPSENDDEFEPGNEVEEESEIESSDEDEFGSSSKASAAPALSSSNTNGHPPKRPRSPEHDDSVVFDHGPSDTVDGNTGFDVDGEDANGFGMASFDGPATFDEESGHDSKRPRT